MSGAHNAMSKHRIDALTDGIFAVAMTLLVIELKFPANLHITSNTQYIAALMDLIPKFIGWVVSFMVLAIFWWGHHRAFNRVRHVDGKLITINILFLLGVSFMPFASSLTGEYVMSMISQIIYAGAMFYVAIMSRLLWRYIYHHPELCITPMTLIELKIARVRTFTLMSLCILSIAVALLFPGVGNSVFILMAFVGVISRRIEKRNQTHPAIPPEASTLSV
jgi:uncharacterized membrane protein